MTYHIEPVKGSPLGPWYCIVDKNGEEFCRTVRSDAAELIVKMIRQNENQKSSNPQK